MNISKDVVSKGNNKFLVSSKEPFLIKDFIEKIEKTFSDYTLKMCFSTDDFLEAYHRGSLFGDSPMIICLWDLDAEAVKSLSSVIPLPTNDILIFIQRKILSKTKVFTNFSADCSLVKINKYDDKEAARWVSSYMTQKGLKYDRSIPKLLVENKSSDLYSLASEVRKLEVIYGGSHIDKSSMRYISRSNEVKVFTFLECLLHKRQDKTLKEFYKFSESFYIPLISMIVKNIEKMYKIAVLKSQGKSSSEIADLISMNEFILKTKYFTVLPIYGKLKLLKLIDLFNELDYQLRLSRLPNNVVFEAYLLKALRI